MSAFDLLQDEYWTTREGEQLHIRQMELSHVKNVIAFLERRAQSIEFHYTFRQLGQLSVMVPTVLGTINGKDVEGLLAMAFWPQGEMAQDAFDAELEQRHEDPVKWLHTLPLIKALDARLQNAGVS